MSRFDEMMKRARDTAARVEENAIADFEKVIARGDEVDRLRERATAAHLTKLDTAHAALSHFQAGIEDYAGNGSPEPLNDGAPQSQAGEFKTYTGADTLAVGNDGKPNASR